MASRYTQTPTSRFSSSPSSFKAKRRWSWASFAGGLFFSGLVAVGLVVFWLSKSPAASELAQTAPVPLAATPTEQLRPTTLPAALPEAQSAPTQPPIIATPKPEVVVLDMQQFTGIDPASGIQLDADSQSLLKEVNDAPQPEDNESLMDVQPVDPALKDAPPEVKQAAAVDANKPVQCETAGVWHLPVRTKNLRISAIFGQYDANSPYFQSLKQVGGLTENAQGVFHPGIDLGTGLYAPVYAVTDGVIDSTNNNDQYGNHIILNVKNTLARQVLYGHLSDIFVTSGQVVKCGQIIGITGNTGKATTGPHLHFEVRVKGQPINPAKILQISKAALAPSWERVAAVGTNK